MSTEHTAITLEDFKELLGDIKLRDIHAGFIASRISWLISEGEYSQSKADDIARASYLIADALGRERIKLR